MAVASYESLSAMGKLYPSLPQFSISIKTLQPSSELTRRARIPHLETCAKTVVHKAGTHLACN